MQHSRYLLMLIVNHIVFTVKFFAPNVLFKVIIGLERIEILQICFPDFKITYVPRTQNQISDSLAKTARSFHRELYFIGCSIPVWLPRLPQV